MTTQGSRRWSIAFGVWWGVPVRLHLLLFLFAAAALAVGVTLADSWASGALTVLVLLLSVAIHEAAHCVAALRLGGAVDAVVLSPIGGLQAPRVPDEPEPQFFVAAVGPMTNLCVVAIGLTSLIAAQVPADQLLPLLNPLEPRAALFEGSLAIIATKEAIWVNWLLLLINLLPAYPFDGGPALRAALWPVLGRRSAAATAAYAAQGLAAMFCLLAVIVEKAEPQAVVPMWAPLVTLAIFLFFSAQRDLALIANQAATPRPRRPANPTGDGGDSIWLDESDEMVLVEHPADNLHHRRQEADEAYEDARVDDILARLHDTSFDELPPEDRAVLQRASKRYRSRQQD
ncbi:MAG: site-2 protease family protein [Planctomycetota bacterium]